MRSQRDRLVRAGLPSVPPRRIGRPASPRVRAGRTGVQSGGRRGYRAGDAGAVDDACPLRRGALAADRRGARDDTRPVFPDPPTPNPATIGTRAGWADRLQERGHALRGQATAVWPFAIPVPARHPPPRSPIRMESNASSRPGPRGHPARSTERCIRGFRPQPRPSRDRQGAVRPPAEAGPLPDGRGSLNNLHEGETGRPSPLGSCGRLRGV